MASGWNPTAHDAAVAEANLKIYGARQCLERANLAAKDATEAIKLWTNMLALLDKAKPKGKR